MSNDRKRSTHAHPEVINLLRQIRAGEAVAGVYDFHAADHEDLIRTVAATDPAEIDMSIMIDGLTGSSLGRCSETICDLALETNVPLVFRHHGEVLQLSRVADWPPEV